ncbi:MAG: 2OG-Fe(II) oxygenase [Pseudomonadota bacterium]
MAKQDAGLAIRPLEKGDFVPKIVLPDHQDKIVDLGDQLIAGNTLALWIINDKPDKALWQQIDSFIDQTRDLEVLPFIILSGSLKAAKSDKALQLVDLKKQTQQLFGCDGPSVVIIDPDHRLMSVSALQDYPAAIAACKTIFEKTGPDRVQFQAPVLLLHDVLEPALCQQILDYWETGEKKADGVAIGAKASNTAKADIKKRNDVALLDEQLFNAVKTRIVTRIVPELLKVFHFQTASMEALRIGCYDAADRGHFGRHRDNRTSFTAHRKFAVSLNLNPIDYDGGQVRFPEFGRTLYAPPPGGAVIFSCSLLHEAMPVTKGRRFGIFTFLTDKEGALAEQRMIAQQKNQAAPLMMKS